MTQLKSQLLGLLLGLATAVGCIFYEKLVKEFSYFTIWCIIMIEMVLLFFIGNIFFKYEVHNDLQKMSSNPKYIWWTILYIITGITSLLWYKITKSQSVMVGSIYEVKYIIMLAVIYVFWGVEKFTWNTALGVGLALGSIYFISKK